MNDTTSITGSTLTSITPRPATAFDRPTPVEWRGFPINVTRRETEVLQAIVDGCSTPQVAARLYLSQKTVKNHLAAIYQKLDARDRTQAVLTALRMGIVELDREDRRPAA